MSTPLFRYSLIRWVPSPTRGEFVNVGLIVFDDQRHEELDIRLSNFKRANRLAPTPYDFRDIINLMLMDLQVAEPIQRAAVLFNMVRNHQNIIQFSKPLPMAIGHASEGMDRLYPSVVGDE